MNNISNNNNNNLSFNQEELIKYLNFQNDQLISEKTKLEQEASLKKVNVILEGIDRTISAYSKAIDNPDFERLIDNIFETSLEICADTDNIALSDDIHSHVIDIYLKCSNINEKLYNKIKDIAAIIHFKEKNLLVPVSDFASKVYFRKNNIFRQHMEAEKKAGTSLIFSVSQYDFTQDEHEELNQIIKQTEIDPNNILYNQINTLFRSANLLKLPPHIIGKYRKQLIDYFYSQPYKTTVILQDLLDTFGYALAQDDKNLIDNLFIFVLDRMLCGYGELQNYSIDILNKFKEQIIKEHPDEELIISLFISMMYYNSSPTFENTVDVLLINCGFYHEPNTANTFQNKSPRVPTRFRRYVALLYTFLIKKWDLKCIKIKPVIEEMIKQENDTNSDTSSIRELDNISFHAYTRLIVLERLHILQDSIIKIFTDKVILNITKQNHDRQKKNPSKHLLLAKYFIALNTFNSKLCEEMIDPLVEWGLPIGYENKFSKLRGLNQAQETLHCIEKLESLIDIRPKTIVNKAEIFATLGKYQEASDLLHSLKETSTNGVFACLSIFLEMHHDRWHNAELGLAHMLFPKNSPSIPEYINNFLNLFMGIIYYRNGNVDEAKKIFKQLYPTLVNEIVFKRHPLYNSIITFYAMQLDIPIIPTIPIANKYFETLFNKLPDEKSANLLLEKLIKFYPKEHYFSIAYFARMMIIKGFFQTSIKAYEFLNSKEDFKRLASSLLCKMQDLAVSNPDLKYLLWKLKQQNESVIEQLD